MSKSVMTPQQLFTKVSKPDTQRSTFDRSHGYKTTFDAGKLIPFFVDEALPGDTMNLNTSMFGRLATPINPIMDNIQLDVHYFSVPIRLVWDNFQKFMGEQTDPGDSTDFLMPTMTSPAGGYAEGTMQDYLGIPTKVAGLEHRADFLRAIHLVYNEWYRDENLQDSIIVDKDDGPDTYSDYTALLPRGKRKDYFTAALPWAQKGDPVSIPIGDSAPIVTSGTNAAALWKSSTTGTTFAPNENIETFTGSPYASATGQTLFLDPNGTLEADLSTASAQTINTLREAFQIQKLLERDARGGTRYTEMNYSHFGVISPDQRLQRPEYLGGGTSHVNISPIAQQSETSTTPQGNLAAMGTVTTNNKGFTKSFTEHELVIGLVSARADLNYQQGLNRMWSRSTRFDHYFPSFAHLGEQAILNKELFAVGSAGITDDDVFGYQERYAEYRYKPSMVTSLFRSNATASLDAWHLSQDFASLPSLNASFIEEQPPIDRTIAVPSEPHFILDTFIDLKHTRPMPTYSIPGLIDHF
jgi:hypothetical protein